MRKNRHGIKIIPPMLKDKAKGIRKIARREGWEIIDDQTNIFMLGFVRGIERINVYYSKMTVATCINHPTKGRTQLFRKGVNMDLLKKLFVDPRYHTDMGYYKK